MTNQQVLKEFADYYAFIAAHIGKEKCCDFNILDNARFLESIDYDCEDFDKVSVIFLEYTYIMTTWISWSEDSIVCARFSKSWRTDKFYYVDDNNILQEFSYE